MVNFQNKSFVKNWNKKRKGRRAIGLGLMIAQILCDPAPQRKGVLAALRET